jgi:predicted Rossmann fold flavoprotein
LKELVVVGAGPAGLMSAAIAAEHGARVTLLEKNASVGKKLSITGNGRCNLTTTVEGNDLIKGFPGNGRFLHSAFHEFSNTDLIEFFHNRGLQTKVERGNRVLPVSDKAEDVVKVLSDNARKAGVKILLSTTVTDIRIEDFKLVVINTDRGDFAAGNIIITTGGMSYPGTGSTGDGYAWAKQLGHRVIEPRPGLVPLLVSEKWIKELQGLSLQNIKASAYTEKGKLINEDFGELIFTHYGLSGPLILSLSHAIGNYLFKQQQPVMLKLDLKPALQEEKLNEQIHAVLSKYSRKMFKNALNDLLPQKMIPVIISLSGIEAEKECHQITRANRLAMVRLLKYFTLTVHGTRPIAEAIVTAGGVDVKEVNPKTMQSKLIKGIFFAGEILDVDGYTGGYNLQAAFSTGYVAGKYAAASI